jgi:ABC-2 type transport system ATP-binding protein
MNKTASPPIVDARGLTKVFHDFWHRPKVQAVNDLSFEVHSGEVFGLLGPNGSGKSTTIKMMLGLLHPTRGSLRVLGRTPRDVRSKARVGYLPEESYLYPYLTSEETLDFYGRLFDLDHRERRDRMDQLLEMIGLQHARRLTVGEFSKGMARRLGLAQALINDPDLIILDEPTSGLDPLGTRQVKDLILTLSKRGKTVLLSSHLLADVEDVCDRIAILYGGRIQAMGPIRELLEESGRYQMTLPELPPKALREVLQALRDALGEEPQLAHPRRDLEQFFLEVVEKARSEAADTSGVRQPSENLARYLRRKGAAPPPAPSTNGPAPPGRPAEPAPGPETEGKTPPGGESKSRRREADRRLEDLLPPPGGPNAG